MKFFIIRILQLKKICVLCYTTLIFKKEVIFLFTNLKSIFITSINKYILYDYKKLHTSLSYINICKFNNICIITYLYKENYSS